MPATRPSRRAAVTAKKRYIISSDEEDEDDAQDVLIVADDSEQDLKPTKSTRSSLRSRKEVIEIDDDDDMEVQEVVPVFSRDEDGKEIKGPVGSKSYVLQVEIPLVSSGSTKGAQKGTMAKHKMKSRVSREPSTEYDEDETPPRSTRPQNGFQVKPKSSNGTTGSTSTLKPVKRSAFRPEPSAVGSSSSSSKSKLKAKPAARTRKTSKRKASSDSDSDFKMGSDHSVHDDDEEDDEGEDGSFVIEDEEDEDMKGAKKSAFDDDEDDDAMSVVSEKKPVFKRKPVAKKIVASGGLTQAARKKASAIAADAGNLPPMSDLASMFRDMITRHPTDSSGGSSSPGNSPSKQSTSSGAVVEMIVDTDEEGKKSKAGKKATGDGKKQTTLFGFLKSEPAAPASSTKSTKGKKKQELEDDDDVSIDERLAGVDAYTKPKGHYLAQTVKRLGGRKLRVATMCSGTESPLLALGLISREMKIAHGVPFDVEHVFSCELEPYKQAYIERNFAPPILFRDVTELGNEYATTAYGASVKVPGNVDLLIAGTSCVDYSNLNNQKKGLEQKGESGNTFRGMYNWVSNHRPAIVVLENVCSAPWGQVAEKFEEIGYSAIPQRFDTKDFYIPHTRTRGYLVAFRQPDWPREVNSESVVHHLPDLWVEMVISMQRPASSPLEAFLLPPNDPRLHQGRLELAAAKGLGKARAPTDWGRCASRHEKCRFEEGLGTKRPWTDWRDGAVCNFPEGYWNDWANAQTERVQDLTDVSHLRAARSGFDAAFRTLVWNLSQNVDREIGSSKRPGIVPCMTPTMIPYVTNRGGPLIGIEALALQGIPADELLLTRETEDQLADLAGNAMSSTVVGTCMVAAIILFSKYLDGVQDDMEVDYDALVTDSAIAEVGDDLEDRIIGQDQLASKSLDLAKLSDVPVKDILSDAVKSSRYCICEGPTGTSKSPTLLCRACAHTRCDDCSNRPIHEYGPHPHSDERLDAMTFARRLKSVLPMRLAVEGFSLKDLEAAKSSTKATISPSDWQLWSNLVIKNLADTEFHFKSLDRKHQWNAIYDSPGASLRLTLNKDKAVWLLFVKAPKTDNANARRRRLVAHPVARLIVEPAAKNLLEGKWSLQLPSLEKIKLEIRGKGQLVPAWEARLGLQQLPLQDAKGNSVDKIDWQGKKQWTQLEIGFHDSQPFQMDVDITGTYNLHTNCGTAMECLHIKEGNPNVSFFLDPVRVGFRADDPFVFALDHERLDYGQERVAIAKLDPNWRPMPTDPQSSMIVKAEVHGTWLEAPSADMTPVDAKMADGESATCAIPDQPLRLDAGQDACTHANALLVCKVPLPHADAEQLWSSVHERWGEIELQHKGKQAFEALAWITERLPPLDSLKQWAPVPLGELHHDDDTSCCTRCAPSPPELSWMLRMNRLVPVEDVVQAGEYERALKRRPAPLVAQMRLDGNIGTIQIGLNVATLLHRALSRLPSFGRSQEPELSWRLQTDYQAVETAFYRPPKLALLSNRHDTEADQPPNFGTKARDPKLRPEQLRSLTWMLQQEAEKDYSFEEQEIAEATLGPLGWRAEGKASRKVMVRGGVLADQVGYGKTAISLGLIDTSKHVREFALPDVPRPGRIATNATLIVVPAHLTKQWEGEIHKFLRGKEYRVVKLLDLKSINSVSIRDIEKADIVIVALTIFKSQLYWSNLAGFAASGSLPNGDLATRHFVSRLDQVLSGLDAQVDLLKTEDGPKEASKKIKQSLAKVAAERKEAKDTKDAFIMTFGKKRLTGAAYLAMQEDDAPASKAKKVKVEKKDEREAQDPWSLNTKDVRDNYHKMRSPPLHMFRFNRVIIDEFTYVDQRCLSAVTKLESISTWVLSGTPPVSDFTAVKGIADFLHVHLGVDDDTEGTAETTKRRQKGQTAAEAFHSFREIHTASWHAARYGVAQRFLDTFVRQNVAEIGEIHSEERVVSITLPAAEHAIYLELDHHIHSFQGMTKKIMKSATGARADRQMRLSDALGNSADPREALIKRCAHFDMETEGSALDAYEACERIVKTRTKQRKLCEEDLHYTVSEALELFLYIRDIKKGYADAKTGEQERKTMHFAEYLKTTFGEAGNGDHEATVLHRKIIREEGCEWINDDIKVDKAKHQAVLKSRKARPDEDGNTKLDKKLKEDEMKWQLREKSHVLRRLANELVGRTRSLRYFTAVRDVQRNGDAAIKPCIKCEGKSKSEPCILSACGHTGCFECLSPLAMHGFECPHDGCRINLETHQVIPTRTLGREEKSGRFGAKLLQLVAIIKHIEKQDFTDRILIFVQFDDLLTKIRLALEKARIGTIVIEGTATKQANELDRFQKLDINDPDSERVLILNVAAASASGANLTLASHVIFVHPVHYTETSNDRFIATETQAIGRIRRYGQEKRCHIWRLLTANAVDEVIMTERTGKKPIGNWSAIKGNELTDAIEVDESDIEVERKVVSKSKRATTTKIGGKRKVVEISDDEGSAAESWAESD